MTTVEMLDQLSEVQAARAVLDMDKQSAIDAVLTPEIRAQLAAIDAAYADRIAAADEQANTLTEQVKAAVLEGGASVKGAHLQAVYVKGRVTWDGAKLDGMMSLIPALKDARKEGQPSVTIRK